MMSTTIWMDREGNLMNLESFLQLESLDIQTKEKRGTLSIQSPGVLTALNYNEHVN